MNGIEAEKALIRSFIDGADARGVQHVDIMDMSETVKADMVASGYSVVDRGDPVVTVSWGQEAAA